MEYQREAVSSSRPGALAATPAGELSRAAGIDSYVMSVYRPLLRLALKTRRAVQIPAPDEPPGWALEARETTDGPRVLQFRVTAPDGVAVLNGAAGAEIRWLVEASRPGLSRWPAAALWLPDFALCLVSCWLEQRTGSGSSSFRSSYVESPDRTRQTCPDPPLPQAHHAQTRTDPGPHQGSRSCQARPFNHTSAPMRRRGPRGVRDS